ncbi:hypothetical protein [Roseovarius amoyensis]|uniref:hypothetical protein n=1 Tax=Roseovarius amoyensis TaxID=2211448 RepID=UPI000DBE71AA|nr:hypothetical protein [Roseovarius amoyensis]
MTDDEIFTEVRRIKNRLIDCKTEAEIAAVANEERARVKEIAEADRVQAIHIANLKAYQIRIVRGEL